MSKQVRHLILFIVLCSLLLTIATMRPGPVAAATLSSYAFTVNTTADTHDALPGDGVCADSSGQCSLRAATEEADALPAGSSITITVPAGTYPLTLGTLYLKGHRTITIHGAGSTTTNIKGNNTFRVLSISPKMSAHLSQLMIEGGSAPYPGVGGGIYNSGTLTVSNSTLSNNSATGSIGGNGSGGGIYNTGMLSVSNSTFSNNSATGGNGNGSGSNGGNGSGGGIENYGGTLRVSNSIFSGNSTKGGNGVGGDGNGNGGSGNGGGIENDSGTVSVTHSTLSSNSATGGTGGDYYGFGGNGNGGGIENSGVLTVSTSTISGNSANGGNSGGDYGDGFGGGILSSGGTLIMSSGNSVSYGGGGNGFGGGGIYNTGTLIVSTSALNGNSAGRYGGGVYNTGMMSVSSSTFSGNSAGVGGGIDNEGGTLTVTNSTLSGNYGSIGGGIDNYSGAVTLTSTIVANSTEGGNCSGMITEGVGYNVDSGSSCGFSLSTDLNNTDPMLGPLGDNGGPTQTMALQQGSKAIDWVAASSCPAGLAAVTDQRGYARPDNGESTCDIGAYESSY